MMVQENGMGAALANYKKLFSLLLIISFSIIAQVIIELRVL